MRLVGPSGRKVWTCSVCGRQGEWGKGWEWYGYYKQDGPFDLTGGEREVVEGVVCSSRCKRKHKRGHR